LYHTGIARIALLTKGIDEEFDRLRAAGVEIVSIETRGYHVDDQ